MLFYPGTNCLIHRVGKGRYRKKVGTDNRIRHCISCGERKKIGAIVATHYNKILHNYCEDCYSLYKEQFRGIEKLGLKIVVSRKVQSFTKNKRSKYMTKDEDISIDNVPKEWVDWLDKNGDNLNNILEEVEDFINDRVHSEDFEWVNTDLNTIPGFIKFILYKQWQKDSRINGQQEFVVMDRN